MTLIRRLVVPFRRLRVVPRPAFTIGEFQRHAELHIRIPTVDVGGICFLVGFLRARKQFAIPGFVHAHDHGLFGAEHKKHFFAWPNYWSRLPPEAGIMLNNKGMLQQGEKAHVC
ncbi:MAG: hypothetical protein WBW41_03230 [Verrucomicrobiia bacterium]